MAPEQGIWEGVDRNGKRFRCWVKGDSIDAFSTRMALMRFTPVAPSDLTSTFDFAGYLNSQGVGSKAQILAWGSTVQESQLHQMALHLAIAWRRTLYRTFQGFGSPLIWAVFGGDKSSVSKETRKSFQHLGIAHLLAVSGYHVGLMSALFLLSLKAQHRWLKSTSVLGVLIAFGFVAACGNPVSGVRSAGMLLWVWLDVLAGKKPDPWEAFGVMAFVTAASDLQQVHMLGTHLSFVATASLLALRGRRLWWRVPLRAQIGTLALTTRAFDAFPSLFYPVNLLAGPAMLMLGVLGLGAIFGLPWFHAAANTLSSSMTTVANAVVEHLDWALSNRALSGRTGLFLLMPLSLHWLTRQIHCFQQRLVLWGVLCCSSGLGCLVSSWSQIQHAEVAWHQLKGKPGAWLVTDGYGAMAWSFQQGTEACQRASRALDLEGPVQWNDWDRSAFAKNQQWTQPPFWAWVHRNQFNAKSRRVDSLNDVNSISEDW